MKRHGIHNLSLRAIDSAVVLVSVAILVYVLVLRQLLFGMILVGLITTVYFGYTIGGTKYAAGVFVVDVAFLVLLVILGIIL